MKRTRLVLVTTLMIMLLAIGIASAVTGEPSVNFSASDVSGPYPFSVTFTGQAINMSQPFSYHWDFGDGTGAEKVSVSTISPITHTYLHPGKYTVKLAVYDIGFPITTWVSTTKTDYIFVTHVPPTASFTASTDAGVGPVNISFTSTSTGYIEEYTWFIDGVSVSTGDAPITVFTHYFDQVDVPTLYSVILQTKGDGPTLVNSTPKTITIDPQPPVADFSATSTTIGQKPLSVQFKDDSTGYGISTWDWSFGDESFSSQQNPSHIYTRPGTYGVRLIVSSPYGTDGEVKNGFVHVLNSSTDVCPPVPSERTDIGIYKDGLWYLDANGNSIWDAGIDKAYTFGQPGWTPVKGDWNGDGVQDIGIYKDGMWYLDSNGNGRWDDGVDKLYYFGSYGWAPIVGDWTGSGITRIGVYKAGTWYLDLNNNGAWDGSPTDRLSIGFGTIGWESVPGKWG